MKKHLEKLAVILLLVMSVCLFAGCNKQANSKKDTLTVAFRNEPANMDPTGSSSLTAFCIQFQNFDRLIINNGDGTFAPSLAKEWEQIDSLTYRFHLQEGVKFHDGSEMTADDVVYTIARAEKSSFSSSFFGYFNGEACKAVDKYTVDISTYEPFAPFLTYLSSSRGSIVPKAYIEKVGDEEFGRKPIGTGAFKFDSWTSGDNITMVRNDNYWNKDKKISVNKIVNRFITDTSARAIEIESGAVDISLHVAGNDATRLETTKGAKVQIGPSYSTTYLRFDTINNDTYKDINIRKALRAAIDMDAVVKTVWGNGGERAKSYYSPVLLGWKDECSNDYDEDAAKKYLADAVANGFDVNKTYTIYCSGDSLETNALQAFMNQWKKVLGLNFEMNIMDNATLTSKINSGTGEIPFFISSTNAAAGDPDHGLFVYKGTTCTTHNDPVLFDLISKAAAEFDMEKRIKLYGEIQDMLHEGCYTIPMVNTNAIYGLNESVQGLTTHPGYVPDLTGIYFEN